MSQLPSEFLTLVLPYANLFGKRIFVHVQLLLTGVIVVPGKRTVTSVLRITPQELPSGITRETNRY